MHLAFQHSQQLGTWLVLDKYSLWITLSSYWVSPGQTAHVKFSWSLAAFELGGWSHSHETSGEQVTALFICLYNDGIFEILFYSLLTRIAKNQCFVGEVFFQTRTLRKRPCVDWSWQCWGWHEQCPWHFTFVHSSWRVPPYSGSHHSPHRQLSLFILCWLEKQGLGRSVRDRRKR